MLCARNIWLIIASVFNYYYTHKRLINQYTCLFRFFRFFFSSNLYFQFINICMYACVMMTTEMSKNADRIYARHMFFSYSIILAFLFFVIRTCVCCRRRRGGGGPYVFQSSHCVRIVRNQHKENTMFIDTFFHIHLFLLCDVPTYANLKFKFSPN